MPRLVPLEPWRSPPPLFRRTLSATAKGECWHVKGRNEYKPEWGLEVHPDNWKWAANEKFKWREHEGAAIGATGLGSRFSELPCRPVRLCRAAFLITHYYTIRRCNK